MVSRRACPVCKKEFTPDKFHPYQKLCGSTKCYGRFKRSQKTPRENGICLNCGKEFSPSKFKVKRYCTNKCYRKSDEFKELTKRYERSPSRKEYQKIWRKKIRQTDHHKEYMAEYFKEYKNNPKFKEAQKRYQQTDKYKEYVKKYQQTEKFQKRVKECRQTEKHKLNKKKYSQSEKGKRSLRTYFKNRRKTDILFKLGQDARTRLRIFLKQKKFKKTSSTFKLIGCTPKELAAHLEKKFKPGMTWDNHSFYGWHIDHVIPLDSAKNEEDVKRLCHYTNLQPMWASDNLKKSNKF
jgi:hypothetical protein